MSVVPGNDKAWGASRRRPQDTEYLRNPSPPGSRELLESGFSIPKEYL